MKEEEQKYKAISVGEDYNARYEIVAVKEEEKKERPKTAKEFLEAALELDKIGTDEEKHNNETLLSKRIDCNNPTICAGDYGGEPDCFTCPIYNKPQDAGDEETQEEQFEAMDELANDYAKEQAEEHRIMIPFNNEINLLKDFLVKIKAIRKDFREIHFHVSIGSEEANDELKALCTQLEEFFLDVEDHIDNDMDEPPNLP